jgi:hypothetical protein
VPQHLLARLLDMSAHARNEVQDSAGSCRVVPALQGGSSLAHAPGNIMALATGASRGVGQGVALGLGETGGAVYLTGRILGPRHRSSRPWPR